ncbi:MAG: hypothetical protein D6693_02875 [Planctomycetota bacterium]|nr:MAG: hypothetical protein D6693_02875 [Planctomycetota bacterium]
MPDATRDAPTLPASARADPLGDQSPVEVFVSPRVVDDTAFCEYARRLRELIRETDRTAQDLRRDLDEARRTRDQFDRIKAEQIERLQAAAKVLRALAAAGARAEQRASTASPVEPDMPAPAVGDAESIERASRAAERRLSLATRTALTELDRRARQHERALEARAADVGAALHAARRSEEAAREALDEARALARSAAEQGRSLASLHDRVARALERLESAPSPADAERAADEARSLASLIDQAGQIREAIAESITESAGMLDEIHGRRKRLAGAVRDAVLACEKAEAVARATIERTTSAA